MTLLQWVNLSKLKIADMKIYRQRLYINRLTKLSIYKQTRFDHSHPDTLLIPAVSTMRSRFLANQAVFLGATSVLCFLLYASL